MVKSFWVLFSVSMTAWLHTWLPGSLLCIIYFYTVYLKIFYFHCIIFYPFELCYRHITLPPAPPLPLSCLPVSLSAWHHRCVYIAGRWILPWPAASVLQCSLSRLRPTAGHSNELEAIPCLHCLFWSAHPSVCACIHYSCVPLRHTHAHMHTAKQ